MASATILRGALLGLAVASLLTVALPSEDPVASACGFNGDLVDWGMVHVYLECTRPQVRVYPDRDLDLPIDPW